MNRSDAEWWANHHYKIEEMQPDEVEEVVQGYMNMPHAPHCRWWLFKYECTCATGLDNS